VIGVLIAITALPAAAGADVPAWAAGLRTVIHIDTTSQGRATSWGTTLEVLGAYVDNQRTIVVLKGDNAQLEVTSARLVVNGRDHRMEQAVSSGDGYYAVRFAPLTELQTSSTQVSLSLADSSTLPPHLWTLNFAVGPSETGSTSVPNGGQAGNMVITFTAVTAVPGALALRFTETGLTYDKILGPVGVSSSDGTEITRRGPIAVHVQVFDSSGKALRWLDTQLSPATDGSASVSFSIVLLRTGHGPYKVVITGPSGASLERIINA
jgi:hypothetical protein